MNLKHLLAALLVLPHLAFAATISGKLTSGGGMDDMSVTVTLAGGDKITAYCVGKCSDNLFYTDRDGFSDLKKRFKGKKVVLTYTTEKSNDRIIGADDGEMINFVKKFTFVR